MTKEKLIKKQFPNNEFLQSAVLQIVDKCTAKLEKENAELKTLIKSEHEIEARKNNRLISQITEAKEIIRDLLNDAVIHHYKTHISFSLVQKAETFLKG